MVTAPYESVEAGPPPVTIEEGMMEEMVQNTLDTHGKGWSGETERNDTLPTSTDQAFYEMLRKKAPAHDGNNESDQPGPAHKKVRPFPETFETPPGHKENGVHISSPTAKTYNHNLASTVSVAGTTTRKRGAVAQSTRGG